MYLYGVNAMTVAAPGLYTQATSCAAVVALANGGLVPERLVIITFLRKVKAIWMAMVEFQPGIPRLTMARLIVQPVCTRPV